MSDTKSLLENGIPSAPWTAALPPTADSKTGTPLPQAVAHRGFKAKWPENSLEAMRAAVEAGAHGLETDTHLSRDGVVVLSHDPSLKRCFGVDANIADCDWEYLSSLRTLRAPGAHMMRFVDFLTWLCEPGVRHVWVVLDIKINDSADDLVPAIVDAFSAVKSDVPWDQRFVLSCWNATYMAKTRHLLPTFALSHVSFSPGYTSHFLSRLPNLGVNMLQRSLVGFTGSRFLRRCGEVGGGGGGDHQQQQQQPPLFVWTVNDVRWMEWCLRNNSAVAAAAAGGTAGKCIDALITDDPRLFLDVCGRWEDGDGQGGVSYAKESWKQWLRVSLGLVAVHIFRVGMFWVRRFKGQYDYLDEVLGWK